jgi:TatD DNase family protein
MLIDTHAHLNFDAFRDDTDEVIRRSLDGSTGSPQVWMINVGSNYETSKKAVEIAQRYPTGVFATVGLHPINLDTGLVRMKIDNVEGSHFEKEFDYEKYKALAKSEKVVAIGEIGLDYYWRPKTTAKKEIFKQKQRTVLCQQLELARELNLPVIFHCRMAHQDLIEVLKSNIKYQKSKIEGVVHCFTGNWQEAEEYLKTGLCLGFNGIIFKLDFKDIIKKTPLERILVETDCPYLSPPEFKKERNEPVAVKYIAQEIAKIKNISLEEITEITTKNAKKLFQI